MALEEEGVALVAEGLEGFLSAIQDASAALGELGGTAEAIDEQMAEGGSGIDAFGEIAVGALRRVGEIGVNALMAVGEAAVNLAGTGLGLLKDGLMFAFQQAMEGEQTMARLSQVIKSTGGAAGLTVERAQELATQFMDLAGGSDDAILAIEEMGLRMGTVSAEEMPQFIQASLDLGAVMGDNTMAARLLARAQEDPVGTLGQLRRAGILFTEQQEEQIKTMVAAGDTAGATALMMGRISEATGGAAQANAETFAGKIEVFKGRLGEAAETIGTALLPIITRLFNEVIAPAIPIVETIAGAFGSFFEGLASGEDPMGDVANLVYEIANALGLDGGGAFAAVTDLRDEFDTLVAFLSENVPIAIAAASEFFTGTLIPAVQAVAAFIADPVIPVIEQVIQWLAVNLPPAIQTVADFWTKTLWPALQQVAAFIADPVIPIIQDIIGWLAENLPPAIQTASDFFNDVILPALSQVVAFIQDPVIPTIQDIITWLATNIPPAIQAAADFFNTVLKPALEDIWAFINDPLIPLLTALADTVLAGVELALAGLEAVWRLVLKPALEALWDYFNDNILPILNAVGGFISETLAPIINTFVTGALKTLTEAMDGLSKVLSGIAQFLRDIAALITGLPEPPDPWNPGSPTKMELGLRGIISAASSLRKELEPLAEMWAGAAPAPALAYASASAPVAFDRYGAGGGPTVYDQRSIQFQANYTRDMSPDNILADLELANTFLLTR